MSKKIGKNSRVGVLCLCIPALDEPIEYFEKVIARVRVRVRVRIRVRISENNS